MSAKQYFINKDSIPYELLQKAKTMAQLSELSLEGIDIISAGSDLVGNKDSYTINLSANTPNFNDGYTEENLLAKNEYFAAMGVKIIVKKQALNDDALHGVNIPGFTYPDLQEFGAAVAAELETVYGGRLEIKEGTQTKVREHASSMYRNVPEVQKEKGLGGTTGATDGIQAQEEGFVPLGRPCMLDGEAVNKVLLKLGAGKFSGLAATNDHKLQVFVKILGAPCVEAGDSAVVQGTCRT